MEWFYFCIQKHFALICPGFNDSTYEKRPSRRLSIFNTFVCFYVSLHEQINRRTAATYTAWFWLHICSKGQKRTGEKISIKTIRTFYWQTTNIRNKVVSLIAAKSKRYYRLNAADELLPNWFLTLTSFQIHRTLIFNWWFKS